MALTDWIGKATLMTMRNLIASVYYYRLARAGPI
jgi:hypothetical protein